MTYDPIKMHNLGIQQIVLTKTLASELEGFELAVLQAKPEAVIEDHYLKCTVALERLLDNKRELATTAREWSIEQARTRRRT